MKKLKLAFLCDIDNQQVTVDAFNEIMEKFSKSSEIVLGKVYGYSDRRHKGFLEVVNASCFDIASTMRYKKRSSQMDIRVIVDAVELAARDYLDGFIIVAGEGDFAPLLAYLKGRGKFVAGVFKNSENYLYCDEIVELPQAEAEEKPRAKAAVKPAPAPAVKPEVQPEVAAEPAREVQVPSAAPEPAVPMREERPEPETAPLPEAKVEEKKEESAGEGMSTEDIFSELEKIVKEFAAKNK